MSYQYRAATDLNKQSATLAWLFQAAQKPLVCLNIIERGQRHLILLYLAQASCASSAASTHHATQVVAHLNQEYQDTDRVIHAGAEAGGMAMNWPATTSNPVANTFVPQGLKSDATVHSALLPPSSPRTHLTDEYFWQDIQYFDHNTQSSTYLPNPTTMGRDSGTSYQAPWPNVSDNIFLPNSAFDAINWSPTDIGYNHTTSIFDDCFPLSTGIFTHHIQACQSSTPPDHLCSPDFFSTGAGTQYALPEQPRVSSLPSPLSHKIHSEHAQGMPPESACSNTGVMRHSRRTCGRTPRGITTRPDGPRVQHRAQTHNMDEGTSCNSIRRGPAQTSTHNFSKPNNACTAGLPAAHTPAGNLYPLESRRVTEIPATGCALLGNGAAVTDQRSEQTCNEQVHPSVLRSQLAALGLPEKAAQMRRHLRKWTKRLTAAETARAKRGLKTRRNKIVTEGAKYDELSQEMKSRIEACNKEKTLQRRIRERPSP
ncbi:hypothetical protein K488DRAFT_82661 [Vararia minispora EC-137]|uniref:Uncharacterized protein n=1 Tax=Vararia minispora EC-137 TaxID=1314806 RepID=A0ACB8QWK2_9AGAM|nr:hypothetical protein K488DRAFT_82661 [Vararia minispora EC-137]